MAGQVFQPKAAPEFVPGKPSQVVGVAPVDVLAVAFTNAEGRKSVALALSFGTDTEDGKPGVYILADEAQMGDQLRIANSVVKLGVRKWLDSRKSEEQEVPSSMTQALDGVLATEIEVKS